MTQLPGGSRAILEDWAGAQCSSPHTRAWLGGEGWLRELDVLVWGSERSITSD